MKRANGSGSVHKLGRNLRKPWRAQISIGADPLTGAPQRMVIGYFATRKEAEAALITYGENPTTKLNITLQQLFEEWKAAKYSKISKATQNNYNAAWYRLEPLGKDKMRNIRTAQLQKIIDDCPDSKSTKSKIRALATQLWDYALQNDIVQKNYASFLTIEAEEKTERLPIPPAQRRQIAQMAAAGDEMMQTIHILCHTGLRINEFLGLTPFAVIYDDQHRPIAFRGGSKTAAGRGRVTPIADTIQPFVENWLRKKGEYIFCTAKGKRWTDKAYRKAFKAKMDQLGLSGFTPHNARHTFITLSVTAGMDKDILMKIVGHADEATTRHYTHLEIETLRKAVNGAINSLS